MNYTQKLQDGMIYYLEDYRAPKVYNGLYFECLLTDLKIPAHATVETDTNKHISAWDRGKLFKPERFNDLY